MTRKGSLSEKHSYNKKVKTFGDMLQSHRIKIGATQRVLAEAIGSFVTITGNTVISEYERGFSLPSIPHIYALADIFDMDKDWLFMAVVKEHYNRFRSHHHDLYMQALRYKGEDKDAFYKRIKNLESRYYFCTEGKIHYTFPQFSGIMQGAMKRSDLNCQDLADGLKRLVGVEMAYSRSYIWNVVTGRKTPSLRITLDLAYFFDMNPSVIYSMVVKEKALAHIENMKRQWELYKERMANGTQDPEYKENNRQQVGELV